MRSALPAAAALALLLPGCTLQTAPEGDTQMTTPAQTGDAASHQGRTLEILAAAYERIEVADRPALEDQKWPGGEIACTLGGPDPVLAWSEEVRLRVDDEAAQAERIRSWLDAEGYERLDLPSTATATGHQRDGFTVMVSTWSDGRVGISVESPCDTGAEGAEA
ncbi:hypothetical protein [Ornithinimicrobium flavum]|uniref:hypothetical protein n=1 Tax=Ornithinimicrobium flavum TaxID=1288636 RepID=UPI00106FC247|nr:hypothetical protein [Ornithinimicrobium flavum]